MQLSKIVLAASAVWTGSAQAIPAFARGGGKTEKISDFLEWGKYFPVTALVNARPYDKKDSGDFKLRAIHEVELMDGGPALSHKPKRCQVGAIRSVADTLFINLSLKH